MVRGSCTNTWKPFIPSVAARLDTRGRTDRKSFIQVPCSLAGMLAVMLAVRDVSWDEEKSFGSFESQKVLGSHGRVTWPHTHVTTVTPAAQIKTS